MFIITGLQKRRSDTGYSVMLKVREGVVLEKTGHRDRKGSCVKIINYVM